MEDDKRMENENNNNQETYNEANEGNESNESNEGNESKPKKEKKSFFSKIVKSIKKDKGNSGTRNNNYNSNYNKNMSPLGFFSYIFMLLILAIPIVNIIVVIRWSIGRGINVNKRNFARAILCLSLIPFLLYIAAPFLTSSLASGNAGPSEWAEQEVEMAADYGLIAENTFNNYLVEISREEMIGLAVSAYETSRGITAKPIESNPFTDTNNENVLKAATLGIVSHNPGQTTDFRPTDGVTRQDMAIIMFRTAKAAKPDGNWDTAEKGVFSDKEQIDDWGMEAINFAFNHGIIKANENQIAPKLLMSREEGVVCVKRVYERIIN